MQIKDIKVSVIIVNYKVEKELLDCIDSILNSKPKIRYEIIVTDNDDNNLIEKKLKSKSPQIRYIKSVRNIGFGAANNLGVKVARGEYLFFLNPDTTVYPNTVDELVKFLKGNKKAGIVAPLLLNSDGRPYQQQGSKNLGVLQGIVVLSFLNKLFPNNPISKKYFLSAWDKKSAEEVDVVPGTAFLIKKNIFDKIGGFDERFFLYFEEFDLCKRVKKLGYKLFILPKAHVKHIWGASTKKANFDLKQIFSKSRFYYFKKHYGIIPSVLVYLVTSFGREQLFAFLLLMISLPLLIYAQTRGIVYSDEGYILNSAQRILDGQVPYRDFHFAYTPGAIYITALSFILFGQSILAERIMAIILSLLTCLTIYLILKLITKKQTLIFTALFIYITWGPMHINFLWPVMLAIFTGFFTCYLLLVAFNKKKPIFYLLAGVITAATFLVKQNFGIGVLLNSLFFIFFLEGGRFGKFLFYTGGVIAVTMAFITYLTTTQSFFAFIGDFNVYTIQRIVADRTLDTPFIYTKGLFDNLPKTALYIFPLIASLVAGLYALKFKKIYFFLASFCFIYYILGIRPTTDYVHLVPLLAFTGIPLALISELSQSAFIKKTSIVVILVIMITGLFTAFFKGYYRWEASLIKQNFFLDSPRAKIWISESHFLQTKALLSYLNTRLKKGDYIFTNSYKPMFYFISGYRNPTKFDLLSPSLTDLPYRNEIIKDLKEKNVEVILTEGLSQTMYLGEYITGNYKAEKKINNLFIWERKK